MQQIITFTPYIRVKMNPKMYNLQKHFILEKKQIKLLSYGHYAFSHISVKNAPWACHVRPSIRIHVLFYRPADLTQFCSDGSLGPSHRAVLFLS